MRLRNRDLDYSQVEDRRGMRGPAAIGGGIGGIGVIILLLFQLLGGGGSASFPVDSPLQQFPAAGTQGDAPDATPGDKTSEFVVAVVNDVQQSWADIFTRAGEDYPETKLVLFSDAVSTGCGNATSATGPFYCPPDRKVYLDLGFFEELRSRFGSPGDFAQAYVIAHEFGHHIQNVLGIEPQVRKAQQQEPEQANELSVRMELQADCFAGIWGHTAFAQGELDSGDIDEALRAAEAIGDDRIQKEASGRIDPESFTHGSSEQRQSWFSKGYETGSMDACDTFSGDI